MNPNYIAKAILKIIKAVYTTVILAVFVFPLYMLFNIAVKSKPDFLKSPYGFPTRIEFSNFVKAAQASDYFILFKNSIWITVVSVVLLIVLSTMAAYPLSRNTGRFYKSLYVFFLCGLMVPLQLIMLPLYKLVSQAGLMNSSMSLILVYLGAGMPFLVFYNVGFLQTIPRELDEAANIDGASRHLTFWKVIFPLMKTAILTVTVLEVVWIWNDFLMPLLFLKDYKKMTVMVGIYSFIGEWGNDWTIIFALIAITILPVIIVYVIFQKHIIQGFIAGALKG